MVISTFSVGYTRATRLSDTVIFENRCRSYKWCLILYICRNSCFFATTATVDITCIASNRLCLSHQRDPGVAIYVSLASIANKQDPPFLPWSNHSPFTISSFPVTFSRLLFASSTIFFVCLWNVYCTFRDFVLTVPHFKTFPPVQWQISLPMFFLIS